MLFSAYKESGFDIKWVDDTHALAVFSSSKIGWFLFKKKICEWMGRLKILLFFASG